MIDNYNFLYEGVDCTYDIEYECDYYGCSEEGICRCGSIVYERIESIKIEKIVNRIYDLYFDNSETTKRDSKLKKLLFGTGKDMDIYVIDRVLRKFKIWEDDIWDINIVNGYYGQEVESITIKHNIEKKIEEVLNTAFDIDELNDRVEFLLNMEYGNILPDLVGCSYEILDVDKKDIIFGNIGHQKKVVKKDLEHYSDSKYNGIRGVLLKSGNKYRVIDGYHRINSTSNPSVKVLVAKRET